MRAYVFLKSGAIDPFGKTSWITATNGEALRGPRTGNDRNQVRVCRVVDLPYWLNDELWQVELGEPITELACGISSKSARLVRQIPEWSPPRARTFAEEAVWHSQRQILAASTADVAAHMRTLDSIEKLASLAALGSPEIADLDRGGAGATIRMLGESADDLRLGLLPLALHEAAMAVGMLAAGGAHGDPDVFEAAMHEERRWQATRLQESLPLES